MCAMRSYDFAELVKRKVESDELDYKSAMSWRSMTRQEKGKILRHLTAFANTRGGFLVIGVSEDASGVPGIYTGVTEEQAGSFDPTPVGDFINAHVEPPLDYTIERPLVDNKRYVIFIVRPFKNLPHVCSRGVEGELQEGIFYIRTAEASSRPARRAHELQELLRRCMRNEREQLGRILRGILYETRQNSSDNTQVNDLFRDAEQFFRRRRSQGQKGVLFKFHMIPDPLPEHIMSADEMRNVLRDSLLRCVNPQFLDEKMLASGQVTPGSLRYLANDKGVMWQFFDRGSFCFFRYSDSAELSLENLAQFCVETTVFTGHIAEKLNFSEEIITLNFAIEPVEKAVIDGKYPAGKKEYYAEIRRSAADLNSGIENHSARLLRRLGEELKIPDKQLDLFRDAIVHFLERR